MLKKMCAIGGLVVATASGALTTTSSANATVPAWGWGGWSHHSLRFWHAHRSFNGNENALFNRIRIRIRNRNNNVAINNQRQRQREREFQTQDNTDIF